MSSNTAQSDKHRDSRQASRGRRWLRYAVIAGICYLGVMLVLMMLENWMFYHPTSAAREWREPPNNRVQDVQLKTPDGTLIHGWWCPVEGAQGALLYFHGNAGNLSQRNGSVAALQQALGESVFIIDYPGYGKSEGKPSEAGCYEAADVAYDWLVNQQKIAPAKILLYGASLGGAVAVDLASRKPHRALILIRTFTSAPDVAQRIYPFLPVRWIMRNRFDSLEKIGNCRRPLFIGHGTTDEVVPFDLGKKLFEAANEPKSFYIMKNAAHNDPLPGEMFVQLREFLKKHAD